MKVAIVIPARYGSTRFPGKPLTRIAGKTMLERTVAIGRKAAGGNPNIDLMVATEDERIAAHCAAIGVECVMTSDACATGSDRVLDAVDRVGRPYDILVSLQGDAPFTPPEAITALIQVFSDYPDTEVATQVIRLPWADLDGLRHSKINTPFTGTTAIIDDTGRALWFSKNIIPALRKEDALRQGSALSPVHQHIGLYAYRTDILRRFVALPQGHYEQLEGLEQLRFLENGITIRAVTLAVEKGLLQMGIDSPADVERAENLLALYGDVA